ncbi:MAG: CDP-glucose 4,6-dehydratase [Lachnospiraceae bacterium]|nr:CDP-glucose 4,6-dehydratase [Lachnospiraceae bacterium]
MIKDIMTFYKDKKVLVTGHTGFKGSWMTALLLMAGARVTGYALRPETKPSLFELLGFEGYDDGQGEYGGSLHNIYADIRDLGALKEAFDEAKPEIVIHMAAQPIVRTSYKDPVGTYETNVIGTVNLLECCRLTPSVKSIINVTTDKVYRNTEREEGYREDEELCGYDPYSNSKSCSELVSDCYRNSFLNDLGASVTTMRAGNVIGGGDFATDRIIPDCVRAAVKGEDIIVRNPYSTRPYQHVLEPVVCYLRVAAEQYSHPEIKGCYNIGPDDSDAVTTAQIATMFCDLWNDMGPDEAGGPAGYHKIKWINRSDGGPHEAGFLKLDCTKIKEKLGWRPVWNIDRAMKELVEWYGVYASDRDICEVTRRQIGTYINEIR